MLYVRFPLIYLLSLDQGVRFEIKIKHLQFPRFCESPRCEAVKWAIRKIHKDSSVNDQKESHESLNNLQGP